MRVLSLLLLISNAFAFDVSFQGGILSVLVDKLKSNCRVSLSVIGKEGKINLGRGKPVSGVFSKSISGVESALDGVTVVVEAKIKCQELVTKRKRINVGGGALSRRDFLIKLREKILEESIFLEEVYTGFEQPVDLQSDGNSLFLVEQSGKIKKIKNGKTSVFLDISEKLAFGGERGLLGLALHPDFKRNNTFFVNYTRKSDGATVISRFNRNKEKILLTVDQPFSNHNGGGLAFGPDGYLYIALGDGGSGGDPQGNGQSRQTLLGKILRIDINKKGGYRIPRSNPFVGNKKGFKEEIFAYGLRNPWRISFHGKVLFVGDVGQGKREEINIVKRGKNYGWKLKEGTLCYSVDPCNFDNLVDPIFDYDRDIGRSVTGGFVAKNYNNLKGVYIFGDFMTGRIFGLEKILGEWRGFVITDTDYFISSFGRGAKGELYLLDYSGGKVLKIKER